jgi:hypothetical protein
MKKKPLLTPETLAQLAKLKRFPTPGGDGWRTFASSLENALAGKLTRQDYRALHSLALKSGHGDTLKKGKMRTGKLPYIAPPASLADTAGKDTFYRPDKKEKKSRKKVALFYQSE